MDEEFKYNKEFIEQWQKLITTLNEKVMPLSENYKALVSLVEREDLDLGPLAPHYANLKELFLLFEIKPS